jgi:lipopolysaccharide/colanic/teichoic acid biosynthesis glycosyltransferase
MKQANIGQQDLLTQDVQPRSIVAGESRLWDLEDGTRDQQRMEALPTRARWQAIIKRLLDLLGAVMGLLLLSPLFLLISALVKLQDGGPVFYRRHVLGTSGSFDAFKFRTMRTDADAVLQSDHTLRQKFEQDYKLKEDPRITPIGGVLRRHSLDELPQLVNVLLGQMSLVGPRMIIAPELAKYGQHRRLLLSVKPGLTGYWQVCGRQNIGYQQRVEMDVYYIRHWSLIVDLKILVLTPWKVLTGEGAF